jgi:hypothetical protein
MYLPQEEIPPSNGFTSERSRGPNFRDIDYKSTARMRPLPIYIPRLHSRNWLSQVLAFANPLPTSCLDNESTSGSPR